MFGRQYFFSQPAMIMRLLSVLYISDDVFIELPGLIVHIYYI